MLWFANIGDATRERDAMDLLDKCGVGAVEISQYNEHTSLFAWFKDARAAEDALHSFRGQALPSLLANGKVRDDTQHKQQPVPRAY